ncbi:MAG: Hpt domain-containing protein, partial [Myxococcota bacterium]
MVDLDEAIQEFLIESRENLDQLDRDFVALETQPGDPGRIAAIFRTIHTIKGTAGLLGYQNLEHLAHAGESVLSNVRDETLTLTPQLTSALLAMVDRIRGVLEVVERSGQDSQERHDDLVQQLHALNDPAGQRQAESPPSAAPPSPQTGVTPSSPSDTAEVDVVGDDAAPLAAAAHEHASRSEAEIAAPVAASPAGPAAPAAAAP